MGLRMFKLRLAGQTILANWSWPEAGASFGDAVFPDIAPDGTFVSGGKVYGPKMGLKGPKQIVIAAFNQADVGYCYETNNIAENLPAKWASRGINAFKAGHPGSVLSGRAEQFLAAVEAANLMLIAAPTWPQYFSPVADPAALDYRDLAINDPYWRVNWISFQILDEIDLLLFPLSDHVDEIANWSLSGVSKPVTANFTRRCAVPAAQEGGAAILFYEAFNVPEITGLSIDSYEWHLSASDTNGASVTASSPDMYVSTFHHGGIYDDALSFTKGAHTKRYTATVTGAAVDIQRNGKVIPGRSDSGNMPVQYPPIYFNDPPFTVLGQQILPQANSYAPGDKWQGHYVATGRVEISNPSYPRSGRWQPGRFLRNEAWSGFVHGSSALYLFPQTVGTTTATGYIDAAAQTVTITTEPARPFLFGGAVRITTSGDFTPKGWVRRDNPQLSGTPGGAGVYALDPAKATPVNTGTSGSPVTLEFSTEARPWGDDSNAENITELTNIIANLNRMQAHPTGGNLLIDTAQGGRRAFTVMRCPDINADTSLYREDMTLAPIQPGYTEGGVAILDDAGGPPLWEFGWPMGFEGFRVTGDDGAVYIYVRSMSGGDRPTWFPGYAALGLPVRVFRPFELVGFRRVGSGSAVEMTGSSGVLLAGADDGAATWFYIETAGVTQNEGNSGTTAFNYTVRRGGDTSGTDTVTASVAGTGINPANAADFVGGVFPSEVLSFAPGETSKTFTANVQGDTASEFDNTALVSLSSPSAGCALVGSNKSTATLTITNDDAPVISAFIWLVDTLTAAPSLPGAPAGGVHLRKTETTNVTRGGVTMRSRSSGTTATDSGGFASTPWWLSGSAFAAFEATLAPGNWEVAPIFQGNNSGAQLLMIDNPDATGGGSATTRQTLTLASTASSSLSVNDGTTTTQFTNASTAVAEAVAALPFLPVTITDAGGGNGLLRIHGTSPGATVVAIAIRQVP